MIYIDQEQVIGCDVDDTIILHRPAEEGEETVTITDPYDGEVCTFVIHKPHLKLMSDRKARGCAIMVWSQNGPRWAKAVVDALGLKPTLILAKPFMIVDDLPVDAWMGKRTYLDPKISYGNKK